MLVGASALAASVSVLADDPSAIGRSTAFFQETGGRLTLAEAAAARHGGKFLPGTSQVLNFGIGAKPVWIYFAVNNPSNAPVPRRLSIETAWLDRVDVYVRRYDHTIAKAQLGDRLPYSQRPLASRYFVVPQVFDPGLSEVYLR
ncbi:MAG: sensor domain-containing diguanylate cyclase, partial [Hydrogenophilales bacterium 17-61-9]